MLVIDRSLVTEIGFIGLGQMGSAIAERLEAGARLHLYDPVAAAMAPFVARGAVAHDGPHSVADAAKIVFACLPNPQVSVDVAADIAGGSAISTYVEMSTIGREAMQRLAATLVPRHIALVDAPVSGGPENARRGRLTIMAAASPEALVCIDPYLKRIAGAVFIVGDTPGLAQIMKLANNLLASVNLAMTTQAVAMGVKAGLDPAVMIEVINHSSGQNSASTGIFPNHVLNGRFDFGATISTMVKDIDLGLAEARMLDLDMAVASAAAMLWRDSALALGGDKDLTLFVRAEASRVGVDLRLGQASTAT